MRVHFRRSIHMRTFFRLLLLTAALVWDGRHLLGPQVAATAVRPPEGPLPVPFLAMPTPWADSVLTTLSLEERIAQLMMVAAYSNKDGKHVQEIDALVRDRHIGGLIFFQGGPARQAALTNRYQAAARTPLLLGMDLEWGLAMRLDSTVQFPRQMALGAMRDDALVTAMGQEIARQMRRLGVHVSFSPVIDVNNNPRNPVINDRSFGEDRQNVLRKGIAYMQGLQDGGVIAVAKHFPGHGDTDSDSHHTLPTVPYDLARLDSLELWPFKRIVGEGLAGVMVAHLEVPALDNTKGLPSTLSKPIVEGWLREKLGFQGLVFTDALNMKGVADAERPGEIELRALEAGNDVMLFPQDPVKAIERIKQAVSEGRIDAARIDQSCLKVLRAKEWAGLHQRKTVAMENIHADLNTPGAEALRRRLYAGAITVPADHFGLLPFRGADTLKIASVVIGDPVGNGFQKALNEHALVSTFSCPKVLTMDSLQQLLAALEPFDRVVVSVHGTTWRVARQFGIPESAQDIVRAIAARKPTVNVYFANPYRLAKAHGAQLKATTVVAYEENATTQDIVAQAIFGALPVNGRLPVSPSAFFKAGDGRTWPGTQRLGHALPEEIGISSAALRPIDSIVQAGIVEEAFPGAQVLVAVEGRVILDRTYGHHMYDKRRAVTSADVYDLASITKVAATTLALMKLVDEGRVDIDQRLGHYLPELEKDHGAHARMQLRNILTHQAGLRAFEPFYLRLLDKDGNFKPGVIGERAEGPYTVRLAEGRYLHKAYTDSLLPWVLGTRLARTNDYLYSDMGYYLLQAVIERITGTTLDRFVQEHFYAPMGARSLGYRPMDRLPLEHIVPTEKDAVFRKQLVHGDVHDPGAAMLDGVAGHAGLFSNAYDLAKVMQMLVNGGEYGGHRYLSEGVIKEFTRCQFCAPDGSGNRRALGFDRPSTEPGKGPTCDCVSFASFGHTGFTGTMVWADPEQKLVYVFLSNRVYPSAEVNKLARMNIRTRIQEVMYRALTMREHSGGADTADVAR